MKHFCKEASRLTSDAFERDLSFTERFKLRLHLVMCGMCKNYTSNLKMLNRILSTIRSEKDNNVSLSDEARKRIKKSLKRAETDA